MVFTSHMKQNNFNIFLRVFVVLLYSSLHIYLLFCMFEILSLKFIYNLFSTFPVVNNRHNLTNRFQNLFALGLFLRG